MDGEGDMDDKETYEVHRGAHHPHGAAKIGTYKNKTFAYNKADKLDNQYGGYAHSVKRIEPPKMGDYD